MSTDSKVNSTGEMWRLGVDVGGTFTDLCLVNIATGITFTGKILTTTGDPSRGIIEGVNRLTAKHRIPLGQVHSIVHGTTLVANTLIERKGARTGFITTKGYRDVIEIGSEHRYDEFDLFLKKAEPLVPRYLRRTVRERIASSGAVLVPLEVDDLQSIVKAFQSEGITSIAVALFNSYTNSQNEEAIAKILEKALPGVAISLSTHVAPAVRELERFSTTVANAYVKPIITHYVNNMEATLTQQGFQGALNIMLSNGGIADIAFAKAFPIQLVESGPVAGASAASYYATEMGESRVIAFDMGGTTAKITLIHDGRLTYGFHFEVARVHRFKKGSGISLNIPVVETLEIGAGGGSIAEIDPMGLLRVGPESAGADPGPACYGQGGERPTVTDAELLLGYLDPAFFLGGEMALHVDLAEQAVTREVARPMGIKTARAAAGIAAVVNNNMVSAIRVQIAEKGGDARKYSMICFGGAGPVHAYEIARQLGMKRVICPPSAGVVSAIGMVLSPPNVGLRRSYVSRMGDLDWSQLETIYQEMKAQAAAIMASVGVRLEAVETVVQAEMRFSGQGYEVPVNIHPDIIHSGDSQQLESLFAKTYEESFGRMIQGAVELIGLRLLVIAPSDVKRLKDEWNRAEGGSAIKGERPAYFPEVNGFAPTIVYDRYRLAPGSRFTGPAIIEERDCTIVAGPASAVRVDDQYNLIIDLV